MYAGDCQGRAITEEVYGNGGLSTDQGVQLSIDPSWKKTDTGWAIVPWGCRKLLHWIDRRYGHPQIVITENGCALTDKPENGQVHDSQRIQYLHDYLAEIHNAISAGVDVRGYFVWSLMDNFEWASGFSKRFGLYYTDYTTGNRVAKDSAHWYRRVIQQNGLD